MVGPSTAPPTADGGRVDDAGTVDEAALRAACTRFLQGHGRRAAADFLADIPADAALDRYGEGGVVAELEAETAALLGMAAAVFLPSGTMAQQAALRVHADRRGRRVVIFHPACHLDRHEERGYQRLHGLLGRPVGEESGLLTLADLKEVAEPPAALLLELPQRDIGGQLPAWDDLVAQVEWARGRGAAVHLDGARLWECTPYYERTPAEIAALFDTAYVSFYKGLGGLAGCCLVGPEDVVAEVREWRTRHGGTLPSLWPYAASALTGLRRRLPRMPEYRAHALAIAGAVRDLPGVEIIPDPPQTTMLHLLLRTSADAFREAALRLAARDKVWTWPRAWSSDSPRVQRVELAVGDATLAFSPEEVRGIIQQLLSME
jgi:threonine aldolase